MVRLVAGTSEGLAMTANMTAWGAGDSLPSAEEAKAFLRQLAGPYDPRPIETENSLVASAPPTDTVVRRDVSLFQAIEALFGSLPEALPDPLIVVNQEGSIVLANTQTAELFGYR